MNGPRLRLGAHLPRLCLVLLAGMLSVSAAEARPQRVPGRLVVRQRGGLDDAALAAALAQVGARRVDRVAGVGGTVIEADERAIGTIEVALRRTGLFSSVEPDHVVEVADPNDPYYHSQWGLPRGGVPAAWAVSSGAGVTVAVVDTGVDAAHPDLQGQVVVGYDFLNDDADPSDDNGHGTRMSGIIGAARDNAEGLVGVAPDATILAVKALDAQGYGPYSAVANGIVYAVDHGAHVVNLSLVGTAPSNVLQAAVDYAAAHDVIVVAAAGNYGTDVPGYPAASSGSVAVAALADGDARPSFSNYGAWISVAAPGVDVITTSRGGGYALSSGTSPAAAFTSGVFALLRAANPAMPRATAIARCRTARSISARAGGIRALRLGRRCLRRARAGRTGRAAAGRDAADGQHSQPDEGQSAVRHGAD
ncbi:MAG: S8 family serine peptidase [Candidatus Binatia bacterium]